MDQYNQEKPSYKYMYKLFIVYCFVCQQKCTNQIKSNYLNSHGEEAQEKPPGL